MEFTNFDPRLHVHQAPKNGANGHRRNGRIQAQKPVTSTRNDAVKLFGEKVDSEEEVLRALEEHFHHYLPPSRPQVPFKFHQDVTDENGVHSQRTFDVVARRAERQEKEEISDERTPFSRFEGRLLSINVEKELEKLDQLKAEEAEDDLNRMAQEYSLNIEAHNHGTVPPQQPLKQQASSQPSDVSEEVKPALAETKMWCEKYTSERFFDLLTDEPLNRNVLTWLKSWDPLAFPQKSKQSLRLPESILQSGAQYKRDLSFRKVDQQGNVYYSSAEVEFSQENKKVLTLHGPPGTGKSTLARVIARKCGYEAREINGSDIRSPAQLIALIKNAVSQDAYFGKPGEEANSRKPVCLIIDEIDGAMSGGVGGGFSQVIDFLKKCIAKRGQQQEQLVIDEVDEGNDSSDGGEPTAERKVQKTKSKKRSDGIFELRRPIFFICNDFYAKALRPLREITLNVKVPSADPQRLIQRLRQICRLEGLKVDDSVLQEICVSSNYDTRASVNALQFLATVHKNSERISMAALDNKSGGKDLFSNLFSVAGEILFKNPRDPVDCPVLSASQAPVVLASNVRKLINSIGESTSQTLNDTLFENYNYCAHYFDDDLEKTAFFLDTLSTADLQNTAAHRTQNYSVLAAANHLPSLAFRQFCADQQKVKARVQFPKIFRDMWMENKSNTAMLNSFLDIAKKKAESGQKPNSERLKMTSVAGGGLQVRKKDMLLDILPSVYSMLHPDVRDVNVQLFNDQEKESFLAALELMVLFDISLKNPRDSSFGFGQTSQTYVPKFEPDLGHLVTFGTAQPGSETNPLMRNSSNGAKRQRQFLRQKTQMLMLQNYEKVKQGMLAGHDTYGQIFISKSAIADRKSGSQLPLGALSSFVSMRGPQSKKRTLDQISNSASQTSQVQAGTTTTADDFRKTGDNAQGVEGRFRFKFKEGHSKNFRRELKFEHMLAMF